MNHFFIAILLNFISFQINHSIDKLYFIGYDDDYPVFQDFNTHELYKMTKNRELISLYKIDDNIDFLTNDFYGFTHKDVNNNYLTIKKGESTKTYIFESDTLTYLVGCKDTIICKLHSLNKIALITVDTIIKTDIEGYPIHYEDGVLYFSKVHNEDIIHANADIFEINIFEVKRKSKMMVRNVSGEETIILQKGKFIYDRILHDGSFKPFIINTISGKRKQLDVPEDILQNCNVIYLKQENSLVFVRTKGWLLFEVDISNF